MFKLLESAWYDHNKRSYLELQNFVRRETGTAPSSRLVSEWKRLSKVVE